MVPGDLGKSGIREWLIFLHGAIFLVVLIGSSLWQRMMRPHAHYFQNKLEGWLSFSTILIVIWGYLYTMFNKPLYTFEVPPSFTDGLTRSLIWHAPP